MTAPVIYDVTTDSFRPVTQAEVNAMIARLNGRAMLSILPQHGPNGFGVGIADGSVGIASSMPPNSIGINPHLVVWSAEATRAAR